MCGGHGLEESWDGLNILESYWYAQKDSKFARYLPTAENFLMDSGAFTFMANAKRHATLDWDKYTDGYIDFINKHDIKLFFEMDIDSVAGLSTAERLRERIERETGKKSIPVWHFTRGLDYFVDMCKEYDYVAFGGLMTDGKSRQENERAFPWFIDTAHKYGAKIHLLGYSSLEGLKKYRPDSADSSSWHCGSKYGSLDTFNPRTGKMDKTDLHRSGYRLKPEFSPLAMKRGWDEWVKAQAFLRKYY